MPEQPIPIPVRTDRFFSSIFEMENALAGDSHPVIH
jgi:hypothetical protein